MEDSIDFQGSTSSPNDRPEARCWEGGAEHSLALLGEDSGDGKGSPQDVDKLIGELIAEMEGRKMQLGNKKKKMSKKQRWRKKKQLEALALKQLPDDLITKVLARLPYPAILKAKCLSKGWASVFSRDVDDFQVKAIRGEVTSCSSKWPVFAVLFARFLPVTAPYIGLLGYDIVSRRWRKIMIPRGTEDHSFVPEDALIRNFRGVLIYLSGTLLCSIAADWRCERIVVLNHMTGAFRVLYSPESIHIYRGMFPYGRVFHALQDGFILVLFYKNYNMEQFFVQFYDSRKNCWNEDQSDVTYLMKFRGDTSPKLTEDGKLYMFNENLNRDSGLRFVVLVEYDICNKEWREIEVPRSFHVEGLVTCGTKAFMVCSLVKQVHLFNREGHWAAIFFLVEYVRTTGQFKRLPDSHPVNMSMEDYRFKGSSSYEDHIYLSFHESKSFGWKIITYNVKIEEWRTEALPVKLIQDFEWVQGSFSPGLNPFFDPSVEAEVTG